MLLHLIWSIEWSIENGCKVTLTFTHVFPQEPRRFDPRLIDSGIRMRFRHVCILPGRTGLGMVKVQVGERKRRGGRALQASGQTRAGVVRTRAVAFVAQRGCTGRFAHRPGQPI